MSYEKLFTPGSIGNLELKNRIVMPAMGCSLAESTGEAGARMIKYYADRARGGAGLIITEITRVDDETGVGTPNQLSVTNTHMIAQLSRLAEAVHAYDTKIFVQLHHPGNQTPSRLIDGRQPVSASDVTCNVIGEQPRALTTEEVEAMVRKFVTGAVIAQKAGIDGVEIHAAHGYLVSQFLSPHTNKRTDKYGGSFEGRMRFVTEIIMGIKAYCGPKFPISVRMNGSDYLPDGITEEDGIAQAKYLEALGISCINVSCGTYDSGATIIEPSYFKEGWKINLAANIRKAVKIPVIAVCNVKHPAFAEQMLADGAVDFVGIARGHLADPEWGKKAKAGKDILIRKCLGCMECFRILNDGLPLGCTLNPVLGREFEYGDEKLVKNGAAPTRQPEAPAAPVTPRPPVAEAKPQQPENFDVLKEINEYQEVSFKTAPKSVILSNFLEKDGGIVPDFDTFDNVSVQELAKKSILPSGILETETLAVILEKQGKLAQAAAVYEKLMVNNPEKSSTFAVRIAELKAQINENNK